MLCGKTIYETRGKATESIEGAHREKRPGKAQLNRITETYFCQDCNGWHVASKKKTRNVKSPKIDPQHKNKTTKFIHEDNMIGTRMNKQLIIHNHLNFKVK